MYLTDPPTRWGPEGGLGETGTVMSEAAEYLRDRSYLYAANLRGANLREADMCGANLHGVDLAR